MSSTELKLIPKDSWTLVATNVLKLNLYCFKPETNSPFSVQVNLVPTGQDISLYDEYGLSVPSCRLLYYSFNDIHYDIYVRYNSANGKCRVIGDW